MLSHADRGMMLFALFAGGALVWFSLRYAWWRPAVDPAHPRILMYHMISEPKPGARFNGLRVSPAMFERQLQWLMSHGWRSMTLGELCESGDSVPGKAFVVTFDDGYVDNLLQALPLLQKYGCKATLFLVVDRFERDWSVVRKAHHDEGELKAEPKLTDEQVNTLLASGCIELGSHSMTHPDFLALSADEAAEELTASRQALEQRFGVPVTTFAYPFGRYSRDQLPLVERAGYQSAVTVDEGIDPLPAPRPLELKRIKISGKDGWLAFRLRMRTGRRGWR